ncbi:hypothetical protein NC652_032006 [Populus alba x Populus x berolinensis]|nr:hypothetical protein NC652_032006 [Populus alba x Populus x berolinensis]KAJ6999128.1 hypothetical protein NC653_015071 [Populus alba x Populus x berolinensis]
MQIYVLRVRWILFVAQVNPPLLERKFRMWLQPPLLMQTLCNLQFHLQLLPRKRKGAGKKRRPGATSFPS